MQFFKLLVAMSAMVSAQHDATKCDGDSYGSNQCCSYSKYFADCYDNYVVTYVESETCTREEAGSSSMSKFYCDPPTEESPKQKQDSIKIDDIDVDLSAVSTSAKAAGAGIVTILLLWILTPVIICVCICVCVCACSKTCCFAQKQQQIVIQGAGQQP